MKTTSTIVTVLTILFVASCGDSDLDASLSGGGLFVIEPVCAKTQCDIEAPKRCESYVKKADRCWAACYDIGLEGVCCTSTSHAVNECYDCSGVDSPCIEQGFKAALPTRRDEAVATACERAALRREKCSDNSYRLTCDAAARLAQPDAAAVYNCIADTRCGHDISTCTKTVKSSEMAGLVCGVLRSRCGDVPGMCRDINALGAAVYDLLRPEVNAAIKRCTEQSGCAKTKKCFETVESLVTVN